MCQETMTVSTSCGFSFDMPLFQVTNREKNEARKCDYEPSLWGCTDGAVARALASHQCGPGSIPKSDVKCGLRLLVLYSAP